MKLLRRLLFAFALAFALQPCAIDTSPLFVPIHRPEKVDAAFVKGRLGILNPNLSNRYKLIAWRYLSGLPLGPDEQAAVLKENRDPRWFTSNQDWLKLSKNNFLATFKASTLDPAAFYENCLPDAFATAVRTYNDRKTRYPMAELLTQWLAAQQQVFADCQAKRPEYPADPDPSLPPLARADRMYQIAAAHFYAEDLDGAEQRFHDIAADSASPWHETAAYMSARTLMRKASLAHEAAALPQARALLQDINTGPYRDSAQALVGYIDGRLDPSATLARISREFAAPHPGASFETVMNEAVYVLTIEEYRAAREAPSAPPPFDWIHVLETKNGDEALRRWRASGSEVWLIAAIMLSDSPDLIETGAESSGAFDTVQYNTVRLMIANGRDRDARNRLDALLGQKPELMSVENAFRQQRMSLATSFDDMLRWAARRPIGYEEDDFDPGQIDSAPILAPDSSDIFNYFTPLTQLAAAARSESLPEWPRRQLAASAWTRAFMLRDTPLADATTRLLEEAMPPSTADLEAFRTASGDAKRFAGALFIERQSHMEPNVSPVFAPVRQDFRPDWWCAEPLRKQSGGAPPIAVLSQAEQDEAAAQVKKLRDSGSTEAFLAPIVMGWAKSHPQDPRVPEALHRLVRITRYGCRSGPETGAISKAAFDLLHQRYPASDWTRQTPYWFRN